MPFTRIAVRTWIQATTIQIDAETFSLRANSTKKGFIRPDEDELGIWPAGVPQLAQNLSFPVNGAPQFGQNKFHHSSTHFLFLPMIDLYFFWNVSFCRIECCGPIISNMEQTMNRTHPNLKRFFIPIPPSFNYFHFNLGWILRWSWIIFRIHLELYSYFLKNSLTFFRYFLANFDPSNNFYDPEYIYYSLK